MNKFIAKFLGSQKRESHIDFADRVLKRYSEQKKISSFSRGLFIKENDEIINRRFAGTKIKAVK